MSPLAQFRALISHPLSAKQGKTHPITLKKGLSAAEIEALAQHLPGQRLPDDIVELLRFSSGFEDSFFGEFSFCNADGFGLEHFFPNVIELARDGLGNFWLLDIDYRGNWGTVYYVCHDPAIIMKQAEDLSDFIGQVHGFIKDAKHSLFYELYERSSYDVWKLPNGGFMSREEANASGDQVMQEFVAQVPNGYLIVDLRNKPVGAGFAWGKYYSVMDREIRCGDLPLWAVQPRKRNFWTRFFGIR